MKKNQIFTIPNILSMLRIVMIPFILWMFFIEKYYISVALIVVSGITDVLDGFIARRFNMISPLGKALDPIADKLTLLSIIISLCVYSKEVLFICIVFVIKETIMGIEGLIVIKKTGTTYSARWFGKVTTFFLYITMIVFIIWTNIPIYATIILLSICDLLMVMSLTLYTIQNIKTIRKAKSEECDEQIKD